MEVQVDNVWSTPTALHMRVTVWGPKYAWRHRYEAAVPIAEIPPEALECLVLKVKDSLGWEDLSDTGEQLALFDQV